MKYKSYLPLFLLAFTLAFSWVVTTYENEVLPSRHIASQGKSCEDLLKVFLQGKTQKSHRNSITRIFSAPIESLSYGVGKMSYHTRLTFMRAFLGYSWFKKKRAQNFVTLANNAYEKGYLTETDLEEFVTRYRFARKLKLVYDEEGKRLVIHENQKVASIRKLAGFFNEFNIKDELVKDSMKRHQITELELKYIRHEDTGINTSNLDDALTYVHVCRSYAPRMQHECLESLKDVILETTASNKYIRRYIKVKKKNETFYNKVLKRTLKEKRKEDPSFSKNDLKRSDLDEINQKVFTRKALKLSCESSLKTNAKRDAKRQLIKAIIAGEIISNTGLYVIENKDQDIDRDWAMRLGEVVAFHAVSGYIQAQITTMNGGALKKTATQWLVEALKDIPSAIAYSEYFTASPEAVESEVKRFLTDENFYFQLETMLGTVDNEKIGELINEELHRYHNKTVGNLTDEQREESLDNMTDILAHQAYISYSNGPIQTGDIGQDYYAFNRVWDIGFSAENIGATYLIYRAACMRPELSKTEFTFGASLYVVNKILNQGLYNQARKHIMGF